MAILYNTNTKKQSNFLYPTLHRTKINLAHTQLLSVVYPQNYVIRRLKHVFLSTKPYLILHQFSNHYCYHPQRQHHLQQGTCNHIVPRCIAPKRCSMENPWFKNGSKIHKTKKHSHQVILSSPCFHAQNINLKFLTSPICSKSDFTMIYF